MIYFNIPYVAYTAGISMGDVNRRLGYLCNTITNILIVCRQKDIPYKIQVHTCFIQDSEDVKFIFKDGVNIIQHQDIQPRQLTAKSLIYTQNQPIELTDYIFHTEADQVINGKFINILSILDENNYLAPHRLEEIPYIKKLRGGSISHTFLDGRLYLRPNYGPGCDTNRISDNFYIPATGGIAFGGAHLSKFSAFKKVIFSDGLDVIIECGSGFDMFNCLRCLKTVNYEDFYLIHLSGYEYNLNRNGDLI